MSWPWSASLPLSVTLSLSLKTWQGEGRAAVASKDLMLGEHLPPLTLLCKDALGNNVIMSEVPPGLTLALKPAPPTGQAAELAWEASDIDVDVSADLVSLSPAPVVHVLHDHIQTRQSIGCCVRMLPTQHLACCM